MLIILSWRSKGGGHGPMAPPKYAPDCLRQQSATCGPWAKSGPSTDFIRLAASSKLCIYPAHDFNVIMTNSVANIVKDRRKKKKDFSLAWSISQFAPWPTKTRKASVFAGIAVTFFLMSYLFATEQFALIITEFLFCFYLIARKHSLCNLI